jgi:SAM-dependent methyltransferase
VQRKENRKEKLMACKRALLLTLVLAASLSGGLFSGSFEANAKEKPALDVPYEPTTYGIAAEMLKMANVTSADLLYDLGCGDGRIVIMAAKERKAKGVGVDMDPERIRESRENAQKAGVTHLVRFFEQDLFETKISDATVVMLYLWPEVNLKLRPKLLKELTPGTRIVSHSHTMGEWEDDATRTVEGHTLHFFVVPANVTGTWEWMMNGKQRSSLQLTQRFQEIKGSMTIGEERLPIMNGALRGTNISFSVESKGPGMRGTVSFNGRVVGDTIEGRIMPERTGRTALRWSAARDASTAVSIAE